MTAGDYEFFVPQVNIQAPAPRVRFYVEAMEHPGESKRQGRTVFVDREMADISNPGSKDVFTTVVNDKIKQQFLMQYEHWKRTREELVRGPGFTPLTEAPFMRPSQIEELRVLNIMTIEQLASVPDTGLDRIGHGARDLVSKAKGFLKAAEGTAAVQKLEIELAERDSKIAVLERQMAEMSKRFDQAMEAKNNGSN